MESLVGGLLAALAAPVPYVPAASRWTTLGGTGGTVTARDRTAQLKAFDAVGTLFQMVHRLSVSFAQVQWHLWQDPTGNPEDRVEVTRHAALDLWNRPNPFMTGLRFREHSQQHVDLTGESDIIIVRSRMQAGLPFELWPVRPDRMEPEPHPERFLDGWTYTAPDGSTTFFPAADVLQIQTPSPMDPYRGAGATRSVLLDIDATTKAAQYNRNFFTNGASPGGVIEVPNHLNDDEWDEFQQRWSTSHQGVANAHRVAMIEFGGKWVDRSHTMRDMEFSQLRETSRSIMREAFGISKTMLGQSEDVNRATAEVADIVFARWQLVERLSRWRDVLNTTLLPQFGPSARGLLFDYDNPVPESPDQVRADRDSRYLAAERMIRLGVFDPSAVLEALELPDIAVMKAPAPAPAPAPPPAPDDDEDPAALDRVPRLALPSAQGEDHPPAPDVDLDRVDRAWTQALVELLRDWADRILPEAFDALLDQIRDAVEARDLPALADIRVPTETTTRGASLLNEAMTELANMAAAWMVDEAEAQDVTISPGIPATDVLDATAQTTARLLGQELATSAAREALRITSPDSTSRDVADGVRDHLESLTDARPRQYIGAALQSAQHEGRISTLRSNPAAAYYGNEILDVNTCGPCRRVNGRWLGNALADVLALYPHGGYRDCEGRDRCRGHVTAVWRPKQADEEA